MKNGSVLNKWVLWWYMDVNISISGPEKWKYCKMMDQIIDWFFMNFTGWVSLILMPSWLNFLQIKFRHCENVTKLEKTSHFLKKCFVFNGKTKWEIFSNSLWPSQNIGTLHTYFILYRGRKVPKSSFFWPKLKTKILQKNPNWANQIRNHLIYKKLS